MVCISRIYSPLMEKKNEEKKPYLLTSYTIYNACAGSEWGCFHGVAVFVSAFPMFFSLFFFFLFAYLFECPASLIPFRAAIRIGAGYGFVGRWPIRNCCGEEISNLQISVHVRQHRGNGNSWRVSQTGPGVSVYIVWLGREGGVWMVRTDGVFVRRTFNTLV